MGRSRSGALALLFAVAIACNAQAPAASPAPEFSTARIKSEPAALVLGLGDLPTAGFRQMRDNAMTLESMSGGLDRAIVRDQAVRVGFVSGHERQFALAADTPTNERAMNIYLLVYKDASAAIDVLEMMTPKDPAIGRAAIGEALGDSAHGYVGTQAAADGTDHDIFIIEFAYGNAVSVVILEARTSSTTMKEATAVAKRQFAVLQADVTGQPVATATARTKPIFPALFNLGLRVNDLPTGFFTTTDRQLTIADLEIGGQLTADFWRGVGFDRGWGHIFDAEDDSRVASIVFFCEPARTGDALHALAKEATRDNWAEISLPRIGDESIAIEGRGTYSGGTARMTFRSLFFRYGDVVGWISVATPSGKHEASLLTDLGTKLISHFD